MCKIHRGVHLALGAQNQRIFVLLEFGPGDYDSACRPVQPALGTDDAIFSWCRCRTEYEQRRRAFPASRCSPDGSSK
jgi:hypothetical protein